jgi:hypothetical protein
VSPGLRDRIAGTVLLLVALVWIVLVYWTIEPGEGPAAGPRAFPLFFGIALAALSLALVARSFLSLGRKQEAEREGAATNETAAVIATVAAIAIYGLLLEPLGFIPATTLIVAAMMVFILRIRAPLTVAAMALGLAIGCYLVFGKLLGTYLPPGTWITIYL